MTRDAYRTSLKRALDEGRITEEAYDAGMMNIDAFCEDEDEDEED